MWHKIKYMGTEVDVSSDGTIIWNNAIRKPYSNHDGYPVVSIKTEKGWRSIGVARLVATAFIPNPENLPEVDHIDFDRRNFSVNNLRWISHAENVKRSVCNKPDVSGPNNPNYGNKKTQSILQRTPRYCKRKTKSSRATKRPVYRWTLYV